MPQSANYSEKYLAEDLVLNTIPILLAYFDNKFNFIHVNKAYADNLACTPKQLLGKNYFQLFPNDKKRRIFEAVLETGEGVEYHDTLFTNPITKKDGFWDWRLAASKSSKGEIKYLVLSLVETTERKKLEAKLKEAEHLASIGAVAGMVGHDIRNPLQAIVGDMYLVKQDVTLLPKSKERQNIQRSLDSIQECVEYINKIVLDLQDYARPLYPKLTEVNINLLLEQVLKKKTVPQNIRISCETEENVNTVLTDDSLLKRVLDNLITNAIQAMPNGGKLSIITSKKAERILINVEDTGMGIPDNIKEKLFTPMFTTKSKGQGFGLAVCKRITDALSGIITFESEVGKGTKFVINLPTAQQH